MISQRWYPVLCNDGQVISLGQRQGHWLEQHGYISSHGRGVISGQLVDAYKADDYSLDEINAVVMATPELSECDFCSATPATFRVNCRRFVLVSTLNQGGSLGGPYRPILCCTECAAYVRSNNKRGLLEHSVAAHIDKAIDLGVVSAGVSRPRARAAIKPAIAEVVYGMFSHRQGPPEEA